MQLVYKEQIAQRLAALRPCLLCRERIGWPDASLAAFCRACISDLPLIINPCFICGIELPEHADPGAVCAQCQQQRPLYRRCFAPWHFAYPLDGLIHRYKDQASFADGRSLARLLAAYLEERLQAEPLPAAILPIPLHTSKLRARGYNQSMLLAARVAKSLASPLKRHILRRDLATADQKALSRKERRRNMRNAFSVRGGELLAGQHVAIVDDVVTSQATVNAAARCLLKDAGVASVDVYCLARVDAAR